MRNPLTRIPRPDDEKAWEPLLGAGTLASAPGASRTGRKGGGMTQSARSQRAGRLRRFLAGGLALALLGVALPAVADDYNPKRAGHPLRIAAYVVHPVGVVLDYLIMRPVHWVGSHEPFRTIFGHEDY